MVIANNESSINSLLHKKQLQLSALSYISLHFINLFIRCVIGRNQRKTQINTNFIFMYIHIEMYLMTFN